MIYKIVQWFCRTLLYFIKKKINIQNFSYALTPIKKNHGSTTGNICFQPRPIYVVVWHCATVLKRDELIWIIFHNEPLCFLQTKMTGYGKETRVILVIFAIICLHVLHCGVCMLRKEAFLSQHLGFSYTSITLSYVTCASSNYLGESFSCVSYVHCHAPVFLLPSSIG